MIFFIFFLLFNSRAFFVQSKTMSDSDSSDWAPAKPKVRRRQRDGGRAGGGGGGRRCGARARALSHSLSFAQNLPPYAQAGASR